MFKSSISAICISFRRFVHDEGGATAIEYALIASGVSIVIAGTVVALGSTVTDMFTSVATALK
jgi:pilus assembly protein Flp/PilA